jgi:pyrimidine operon attenuation protein/uracil phosphoribosyltransferase
LRLYDAAWMKKVVQRFADSALAEGCPPGELVLAGVRTRGAHIARRVAEELSARGRAVHVAALDVTPYRDDLARGGVKSLKGGTEMNVPLDGKVVIIVDDVLYTGRTARAAMDLLMAFGRPRVVRLYTLVERTHRELPIRADVTGATVETGRSDSVRVRLSETDGADEVVMEKDAGRRE